MSVDKKFFENALKDRGLSLRELSRRLDILPSQMSFTFNGKRRMQISEAVRISQILGIQLSDVMVAAGIEEAKRSRARCPVVGFIDDDGFIHGTDGSERTLAPEGLPEDVEALQVRAAGTRRAYADGFVLFCEPYRDEPVTAYLGRYSRVKLADGRETVGVLRRGYQVGTYHLSGPELEMEDIKVDQASLILLTRH